MPTNRPIHRTDESGVALIEFALVLPLLLMLTLTVLELINAYNINKVASQLSREAANMAYRECNDSTGVSYCLTVPRQHIQQFAETNGFPNTEVIISIYKTDNGATPVLTLAGTSGGTHISRYSTTSGFSPLVTSLKNQSIFVAEVYIPYKSLFAGLKNIFIFEAPYIYDSTVA